MGNRHHAPVCQMIQENFATDARMVGAEIGVWLGKLSCTLLNTFPNLTLIMVDPWELHGGNNPTMPASAEDYLSARGQAKARTDRWEDRRIIRQGYSPACIDELAPAIKQAGLDWVFVDGGHMYDEVKADVLGWYPLLKSGGVMSGHDYAGRGDRRWGWGVQKFVDEWAAEQNLEVHFPGGLVWWVKKP